MYLYKYITIFIKVYKNIFVVIIIVYKKNGSGLTTTPVRVGALKTCMVGLALNIIEDKDLLLIF